MISKAVTAKLRQPTGAASPSKSESEPQMKLRTLIPLGLILGGWALCGFSCATLEGAQTTSANVAAATPAICADLQVAGALTTAVAQQIIAANPNNPKVVLAASKVIAGATLTAADCNTVAAVVQLGNATIQAAGAVQ